MEDAINTVTKDDDLFCPTLTYKQRLIGFLTSVGIGYVLSILSYISIVLNGFDAVNFVLLYSLGNLCIIFASCFLWGPKRQCKSMMKPTRMAISIILLLLIAGTIVCAFILGNDYVLIIIILGVAELFAMFWYNMSYIPFARKIIKKCCKKCCCDCEDEESGYAPAPSS